MKSYHQSLEGFIHLNVQKQSANLLALSVEHWQPQQIRSCQKHLEISDKLISYLVSFLIVYLQFQIRRLIFQLDVLESFIPKTISLPTRNGACNHFDFIVTVRKNAIHIL